jgi:hypothetical protein
VPWTNALTSFDQYQHIRTTFGIKAINLAGPPCDDKRLTHGQISYRHLIFVEKDRSFFNRLIGACVFIGFHPIITFATRFIPNVNV